MQLHRAVFKSHILLLTTCPASNCELNSELMTGASHFNFPSLSCPIWETRIMPPFLPGLLGTIKCNHSYSTQPGTEEVLGKGSLTPHPLFCSLLWSASGVKSSKEKLSLRQRWLRPTPSILPEPSHSSPCRILEHQSWRRLWNILSNCFPFYRWGNRDSKPKARPACIEAAQWCVCLLQTGPTITTK